MTADFLKVPPFLTDIQRARRAADRVFNLRSFGRLRIPLSAEKHPSRKLDDDEARVLAILQASDKPLRAYQVGWRASLKSMDAYRVLTELEEHGMVKSSNDWDSLTQTQKWIANG